MSNARVWNGNALTYRLKGISYFFFVIFVEVYKVKNVLLNGNLGMLSVLVEIKPNEF